MNAVAPAPVVTRPRVAQLLWLALPIVISRSTQVVVGLTDAVMCGRLGESALAATTAGATNSFTFLTLAMGTAFIVSSFSSQLVGRGDHAGAKRYAWYGLGIAVLAGLLSLATIPFVDDAVSHLEYAPDVKQMMIAYIKVRLLSGAFVIGLEALGNYYNGLGNTWLPMLAQMLAMVLNVVFCWLLIFGNSGAPALGVLGSAWAAVAATFIAFCALFGAFLLGMGQPVKVKTPRLHWAEMGRTLRFGLPVGLNWFVEFAAFSFFINGVLTGLGTTALAGMLTVMQVNSTSFMPAFAIASAGSIFVGQAIGARKLDDVPRTVKLTLACTATWQGLVALLYLAIPTVLMSAFTESGAAGAHFLEVGARLLMLSAAWQLFDAVAMSFAEALRAAGDTAFTFWARAASAWLVFAPGAWISVRVFDATYIGAASWLIAWLAVLALLMVLRFRQGKWRTMDLTGTQHAH